PRWIRSLRDSDQSRVRITEPEDPSVTLKRPAALLRRLRRHNLRLALRALQVLPLGLGLLLGHEGVAALGAFDLDRAVPGGEVAIGVLVAAVEDLAALRALLNE